MSVDDWEMTKRVCLLGQVSEVFSLAISSFHPNIWWSYVRSHYSIQYLGIGCDLNPIASVWCSGDDFFQHPNVRIRENVLACLVSK